MGIWRLQKVHIKHLGLLVDGIDDRMCRSLLQWICMEYDRSAMLVRALIVLISDTSFDDLYHVLIVEFYSCLLDFRFLCSQKDLRGRSDTKGIGHDRT